MKFRYTYLFVFLLCSPLVNAQIVLNESTIPAKTGFVDKSRFTDEKNGILELVAAIAFVNESLRSKQDEINGIVTRINIKVRGLTSCSIQGTKRETNENILSALTNLQKELKASNTEYEDAFVRLTKNHIEPVKVKINERIIRFGVENGYAAIFDLTEILVDGDRFLVSPDLTLGVDITDAFIEHYNNTVPFRQLQ